MLDKALIKRLRRVTITEFAGARPEDIVRCEHELDVAFPPELREWLLVCGDATTCDGQAFLGVDQRKAVSIQSAVRGAHLRKGLLPILMDGCGNLFALACDGESRPVVYLELSEGDSDGAVVASSLERFLSMFAKVLAQGEVWPRDRGVLVRHDPEIDKVHGYRMMWESEGDEDLASGPGSETESMKFSYPFRKGPLDGLTIEFDGPPPGTIYVKAPVLSVDAAAATGAASYGLMWGGRKTKEAQFEYWFKAKGEYVLSKPT